MNGGDRELYCPAMAIDASDGKAGENAGGRHGVCLIFLLRNAFITCWDVVFNDHIKQIYGIRIAVCI